MSMILKKYIPIFLLIILLSCIVLMCTVPPVSRDALTHHLAVPKIYVQHGGIVELPDLVYSYYPQLLDLLYCVPLMFHNDILPKFIHFSFALLTAIIIFQYVRKKIGVSYALFSVLFFLSMPVIVKLSITVYVDLGLIFFSTVSLLSLFKWYETKKEKFWFVLSAIFCGLALGTKYNALISLFLLTVFIPAIYLKFTKKDLSAQLRSLGAALVFFLIAVAIFSPWMIKNYVWTKNPVYPLYNNLLKTTSEPEMNHFLVRKHVYNETWWETALIPVRVFFHGKDDDPKFFDGKLNPFLLILPIFAFINFSPPKPAQDIFERKILLSFAFLYIMIVFFQQDMRIRWIGPAIPPLVILSAYGVKNIFDKAFSLMLKKNDKVGIKYNVFIFIIYAFIIFMMGLNGVYLYKLFKSVDPLPYLSRQITREEYIEKFRPEFAALNFSNINLDKNTKLLGLFLGERGYYSDHEILFKISGFKDIIEKSSNCNEVLTELKALNFTDTVLNYEKLNNWINVNFSTSKKIMIKDFFNHSVDRLFSKGGYGLYHLK